MPPATPTSTADPRSKRNTHPRRSRGVTTHPTSQPKSGQSPQWDGVGPLPAPTRCCRLGRPVEAAVAEVAARQRSGSTSAQSPEHSPVSLHLVPRTRRRQPPSRPAGRCSGVGGGGAAADVSPPVQPGGGSAAVDPCDDVGHLVAHTDTRGVVPIPVDHPVRDGERAVANRAVTRGGRRPARDEARCCRGRRGERWTGRHPPG